MGYVLDTIEQEAVAVALRRADSLDYKELRVVESHLTLGQEKTIYVTLEHIDGRMCYIVDYKMGKFYIRTGFEKR